MSLRCIVLFALACPLVAAEPVRYSATPLTEIGSFTDGVEGPACDDSGDVFAVNFEVDGTIGRVTPSGVASILLTLPAGSRGNAIRFNTAGDMFIADYVGHNVLKVARGSDLIETFVHEPLMHQPNDLTIAGDGTIYASDPDWHGGGGRVWKVTPDGQASIATEDIKLPNGIELSPDGSLLYVAQTKKANVMVYHVAEDGTLHEPQVFVSFGEHLVDGLRCDTAGNLYIARYDAGVVSVVSPTGLRLAEVDVLGQSPTNVCLSPDQKTVYVTEVEHRRLVQFPAWPVL